MKRLYFEAAVSGLEIDVAQRSEPKSAARLEAMQEPLALAGLGKLLLVRPERFLFNRFERELNPVGNAAAAFELIGARALEPVRHQSPALRQRVLSGGAQIRGQR